MAVSSPDQFSPACAVGAPNPTLSDTVDDPQVAGRGASRGILFAATGNAVVVMLNGDVVTFTAVAANTYFPLAVRRVKNTGTTIANTNIYLLL